MVVVMMRMGTAMRIVARMRIAMSMVAVGLYLMTGYWPSTTLDLYYNRSRMDAVPGPIK